MADLTKRAYAKTEYTDTQLLEFSKCFDPYYFLNNYFTIQHPIRGSMIYKAYSYQDELVNSYHSITTIVIRFQCLVVRWVSPQRQPDIFFGIVCLTQTKQF